MGRFIQFVLRWGYSFSLSGLAVESEKEKLLCVFCVSSAAGGENNKDAENKNIKDQQSMTDQLLEIENLSVHFHIPEGVARAVDGVSFHLAAGETIGLVGESGCGKSVTSLSILGLIPSPPGRIESGKIMFRRQNLLDLNHESLRQIRGRQISMIFQEPMTSLNPAPMAALLGESQKNAG